MKPPPRPTDEERRVEALRRYAVFDTLSKPGFDDLAKLAAQVCEAPIALISLIDEQWQRVKSKVGWSIGDIPRDISFGGHAILQPDLLIVPDTSQDHRFADN